MYFRFLHILGIQFVIGQAPSQNEGILTTQNCPDCARGEWTCSQPECSPGVPVNGHIFNFEYYNEGCTEEIAATDTSVYIDHDMWCLGAATGHTELRERLTCSNMEGTGFDGVSAFKGCNAVGRADSLLQERCSWSCKNGRPAIRCVYQFDVTGEFTLGDGRVDYCFVSGVCVSNSQEHRTLLCKRDDYLKDMVKKKKNKERVKALKNATMSTSKADQKLIKANKAKLTVLQAKLKDEQERLAKAKEQKKQAQAKLEKERAAHEKTKGKMEGKQEQWQYQRKTLLMALVVAIVSLAAVVYFGLRFYRNWIEKMQMPVPTAEAEDFPEGLGTIPDGNGTVVFGRPVELQDTAKGDCYDGTVQPKTPKL